MINIRYDICKRNRKEVGKIIQDKLLCGITVFKTNKDWFKICDSCFEKLSEQKKLKFLSLPKIIPYKVV